MSLPVWVLLPQGQLLFLLCCPRAIDFKKWTTVNGWGKNQKKNLLWHMNIIWIKWNSNVGNPAIPSIDCVWTTRGQSDDRDGMGCATSTIYHVLFSVKSLPLLQQCPQSPNCGQERHHKLPHTGPTANSLLWGGLNQNLLLDYYCLSSWPLTEWQPLSWHVANMFLKHLHVWEF